METKQNNTHSRNLSKMPKSGEIQETAEIKSKFSIMKIQENRKTAEKTSW